MAEPNTAPGLFGLYPGYMVQQYVIEKTGIAEWSFGYHVRKGDFPRATHRGPGHRLYYTEAEVVRVLDWWRDWWRAGRGSAKRDRSADPFGGAGE